MSGRKELHCTLWRRLFDACLVALESISPGQRIYYGTLRCRTLPSKKNFPRQRLPPWFFATDFSLARTVQCRTFLPTKGRDRNFLLLLWIYIICKIQSHLNRESIYSSTNCKPSSDRSTGISRTSSDILVWKHNHLSFIYLLGISAS